MNRETKKLLKQAFAFPAPENRSSFLETLRPRTITMTDFVLMQVAYIRKSVWVLMFLILGVAIVCAWRDSGNSERMIAAVIPFAAAAAVVETQRSSAYHMTELEAATRHSLRSIVFAKMLIMGIVFLGVFVIVTPIVAITLDASLIMTAAHILIPYLITMMICLNVERTKAGHSNMYLSIAIAAGVSVCVFLAGTQTVVLIKSLSESLFVAIAVLLLITTALECRKTINKVEAFV